MCLNNLFGAVLKSVPPQAYFYHISSYFLITLPICSLKPGSCFDGNFCLNVVYLIHHYQAHKTVLWHLCLLTCIKAAERRDNSILIILLRLEKRH